MIVSISILTLVCLLLSGIAAVPWSHESPEKWPGVCQTGSAQSPINIAEADLEEVDGYEPFIFHGYDTMPCDTSMVKNDGHSVVMDYSEGLDYHFPYFSLHIGQTIPTLTGGGLDGRYRFAGLHFHWGQDSSNTTIKDLGPDPTNDIIQEDLKPDATIEDSVPKPTSTKIEGSEHTIDGTAYSMELHIVHFKSEYGSTIGKALNNATMALEKSDANDVLAVLGIFVQLRTKDNPKLEPLVEALEKISQKGNKTQIKSFPLVDLLPSNTHSFFRYNGSLTTPGCNEVVVWTVFKDPIGISAKQLEKFRQLEIGSNFRPVQATNGRRILNVETSTKNFSPAFAKCPHSKEAAPLLNTVHVLEKEEPVETIKPPTPEKEVKKPPIDADHYYADVFEME